MIASVDNCQKCGEKLLVTPLYGDRGGPLYCVHCGLEWHAEQSRLHRLQRILVGTMKQLIDAGGNLSGMLDRLKLAAWGSPVYSEEDVGQSWPGEITLELLESIIRLTHPDRHPPERRDEADRVTRELLAIKPWVFPAPPPKAEPEPMPERVSGSSKNRIDELNKALKAGAFPCKDCVDTIPYYYCASCKAEWNRRRDEERGRERKKRREQYARRKQYIRWRTPAKTCPVCDASFKGKRTDAVYCSSTCRQRAHRDRNG